MASAGSFPIEVVLKGMDLLSPKLQQAGRAVENFAAQAKKLGVNSSAVEGAGKRVMAAGAVTGAALGGIFKSYMDYNRAMLRFDTVLDKQLEGPWVDSVKKLADQLGKDLPGSVEDILNLATAMGMAGASAKELATGSLQSAANLSVVTETPYGEMGRMFQEMQQGLGIAGKDAEYFADQLQRVSLASGLKMPGLHGALGHAAGAMKSIGIGGKEDADLLLAWMGALKQKGLDDSMIGTGLKRLAMKTAAVQRMVAGGDTKGAAIKRAGLDLSSAGIQLDFFDDKGKQLGLANIIGQLGKIKGLSDEQRGAVSQALFGDRAMLAATLVGVEDVNAMLDRMKGRKGLGELMKARLGSTSGLLDQATGTMSSVIKHSGQSMETELNGMLKRVNKWASALDNWVTKNPKTVSSLLKIVTTFSAVALAGGGAAYAFGKIAGALPGLAKGLKLASVAVSANPWLLVLIAGGALLAANWDKVGPIMEGVAVSIGNIFDNVKDLLGEQLGLLKLADDGSKKFKGWGENAWILAKAIETITLGVETLSGYWKSFGTAGLAVTNPINELKAGGGAAVSAFENTKGSLWDKLKAANTSGSEAMNKAKGESLNKMLDPFDKIAARDPWGVNGKKVDKITNGKGNPPAVVAPMETTFHINGGDPKAIADQVNQMMRDQAAEFARILAGGKAIADRGRFATGTEGF